MIKDADTNLVYMSEWTKTDFPDMTRKGSHML